MNGFINYILIVLFMTGLISCNQKNSLISFYVDYGKVNSSDLIGEDMVIVEPDNYTRSDVLSLRQNNIKVIAYISLGEVNPSRWYYSLLEKRGFIGINENWNSPYIDLEDSISRSIIVNTVIPDIMKKGFDGLFLDTIDDVASYTNRSYLQPYMIELIRNIHDKNKGKYIIQNAGFFLVDKTKNFIDAMLVEDVATSYDFTTNTYHLATEKKYQEDVDMIRYYQKQIHKPFFIVDYANTESLRQAVKKRLDTLGISYFIGTINLNATK
ncbi:MAG TPA: endo alpha-1,4 polygalactosaminidase [Bacteroidales bacterium]|nr:endo alpha-1,4 polygalactosaminidase [Bacteroidales bacterium]